MSGPILNIQVNLDGAKQANDELKKFEGEARKSEKAAGGLTSSVGKLAAGFAAFAATAFTMDKMTTTLAGFEKSMSSVQAITRANAQELAALRDVAKELGATTEYSASQAADALKFLGMAGFQAKEAIAAIPAVLDLATASSMGLAEAADVSSNIMSGFGLSASQAGDAADILAAAATRANTDVSQLGSAMKFAAPVAHSLGITMGDTAAAIGVMSDAGIQGSQAGTGLRAVLASLVKPSKDGQAALKAMGLTLKDINPQVNSLSDIFTKLRDRGLNAQAAMMLFGREAASAGLSMAAASDRLGELSGQLRDVNGEAKRMADTMRDNLAGDIDNLSSATEGLIIAIGEAGLTSALRASFQATTEIVSVLAEMSQYLPEVAYVVGTVATALGVNYVLAAGAASIASLQAAAATAGVSTAMAGAQVAAYGLGRAIGLLGAAYTAMGGPVGLAIGAVAGVMYVLNQRANEAKQASERYAEAIKLAGDSSNTAAMGIQKAAEELFKLTDGMSRADLMVQLDTALKTVEASMLSIREEAGKLGSSFFSSSRKIGAEIEKLRIEFESGEKSVEEFVDELDRLAAQNPDYSSTISGIQDIARTAAAARGEVNALNAALINQDQYGPFLPEQQGPQLPEGWKPPIKVPELNLPELGGGGGGGGGRPRGGGGVSEAEKIADDMKQRLEALKTGLQSEMQAKVEAYAKDMETLKWYLDNKKMTEEEYELWKDQLQEKSFERGMTEEERLTAQYERELEMLNQFLEQKKISEEEFLLWQKEINQQHEEEMLNLRGMQYAAALDATGDLMGSMAQVIGSGNDKMIKAQKIFGAASALVSTYIGAAKALELPFPANLAAMATVLAKGMSLVAAIKSGSKSNSSGGGAVGNTQSAAPERAPDKRQAAEIKLHGEVFNRDMVAELIGKINDMGKDGYVIDVVTA